MTRSTHPFIRTLTIFVVLFTLLGFTNACSGAEKITGTETEVPPTEEPEVSEEPGPTMTQAAECARTVVADVVVLDQILPMNRLGAVQNAGQMFALVRDVVPESATPTMDGWDGGPYSIDDLKAASGVRLRSGKRPRPIVLRANIGDCLQINFTNLFDTSRSLDSGSLYAGFHIAGLNLVNSISDDASWVGANPGATGSFATPGETVTYTYYAGDEGVYYVYSGAGNEDNEAETGLFGAVNVQPKTAEWYRSQVNEIDLRIATFRESQFPLIGGIPTFESPSGTFKMTLTQRMTGPEGSRVPLVVGGQQLYHLTTEIFSSQTVTTTTVVLTQPDPFGNRFLNTQASNHPIINYEATYPASIFGPRGGDPVLSMTKEMVQGTDTTYHIMYSDLTAIITGPNAGRFSMSYNSPLFYEHSASPDRRQPYREFTITYHEYPEAGPTPPQATQAFPIMNEISYAAGLDGFGINYGFAAIGTEIIANRIHVGPEGIHNDEVDLKFEEFFLSSWAVGDPAMLVDIPANESLPGGTNAGNPANTGLYPDDPSNVYHSYMRDHVKFRILNATRQGTSHVHHQHAHQWLHSPNSDESHYLDSQLIVPGATYTLEMVYNGSGNRNQTVGDSIFHCHFYPHFAMGMWSLWRVHDVFEAGTPCEKNPGFDPSTPPGPGNPFCQPTSTGYPIPAAASRALPDGELARGSWIPALVPLPTIAMAPLPAEVRLTTDADDVNVGGKTIPMAGRRSIVTGPGPNGEENPGFPFFIPGVGGHRPPHPPLDFAWEEKFPGEPFFIDDTAKDTVYLDGGLPRHQVLDGTIFREAHSRWDFTKDFIIFEDGTFDGETGKGITDGNLIAFQLPESGTAAEKAAMRAHAQRAHASFLPNGNPGNFILNGLPPIHGAPYAEPGVSDDGNSVFDSRRYKAANIELDVVLNKKGWHYPQQRILTLWNDVAPTIQGERPPQPFFFRSNTGETIDYWHTNLMPNYYELDDYQVRTPTDVIGQHIHLVKFDVTASDGAANGFNYEDATFSPEEIHERLVAINKAGGLYGFSISDDFIDTSTQTDLRLKRCGIDVYKRDYTLSTPENCVFGIPVEKIFLSGVLAESDNPAGATGVWASPYDGAWTTIQRWDADPLLNNLGFDRTLRTVFTHDHLSPSTHQQAGLYAGLVIEPAGALWFDPVTGERLYNTTTESLWRSAALTPEGQYDYIYTDPNDPANWVGITRYDGGPTNWQANIHTENPDESFREFMLEFADFQLAYTNDSKNELSSLSGQIYFTAPGDSLADDSATWINDLNSGTIPAGPASVSGARGLRGSFVDNGITLSANVAVCPGGCPNGGPWTLVEPTDATGAPDAGQTYRLEVASGDSLDIFTETLTSWSDYISAIQPPKSNTQRNGYRSPRCTVRLNPNINPDDNTAPICAPFATLVSTGGLVGTYSLNYRNEPIPHRVNRGDVSGFDAGLTPDEKALAEDLAFAFASIPRNDVRMNSQPAVDTQIDNGNACPPFEGVGVHPAQPFCYPKVELTPGMGPTDPFTPLLRAYENDNVQIRTLVGAHTLSHSFELFGLNWDYEPSWANSGKTSVQGMGISEHYEMIFQLPAREGTDASDFLYAANAGTDGLGNGIWGILRSYDVGNAEPDLQALPNNPVGQTLAIDYNPPLDATIREFDIVATTSAQAMQVGQVVYNERGKTTTDGTNIDAAVLDTGQIINDTQKGLVYVMTEDVRCTQAEVDDASNACTSTDGISPKVPGNGEPLILRAAAGEWIRITLHNCFDPTSNTRAPFGDATPAVPVIYGQPQSQVRPENPSPTIQLFPSRQVGLHAQLLSYDVPTAANGVNVGSNESSWSFSDAQTVPTSSDVSQCLGSASTREFLWYAGELSLNERGQTVRTPIEFGAINLLPADPLLQHQYGLIGALIIEPEGSSWTTDTGTQAAATVTRADGTTFRDFVAILQADVTTSENRAQAINYRSEPQSYRFAGTNGNTEGQARLYSNTLVWNPAGDMSNGEPQTPIFEAAAGDEARLRMLYTRGQGRRMKVVMVNGHNWQEAPYTDDGTVIGYNDRSQQFGSQQITSDQTFNLVFDSAGGVFEIPGDYLYHTYESPNSTEDGAWGLFRVEDEIYISQAYLNPISNELTVKVKGKSAAPPTLTSMTISVGSATLPNNGAATYDTHEEAWVYVYPSGTTLPVPGVDACEKVMATDSNNQTSATVLLGPCTQTN